MKRADQPLARVCVLIWVFPSELPSAQGGDRLAISLAWGAGSSYAYSDCARMGSKNVCARARSPRRSARSRARAHARIENLLRYLKEIEDKEAILSYKIEA